MHPFSQFIGLGKITLEVLDEQDDRRKYVGENWVCVLYPYSEEGRVCRWISPEFAIYLISNYIIPYDKCPYYLQPYYPNENVI